MKSRPCCWRGVAEASDEGVEASGTRSRPLFVTFWGITGLILWTVGAEIGRAGVLPAFFDASETGPMLQQRRAGRNDRPLLAEIIKFL